MSDAAVVAPAAVPAEPAVTAPVPEPVEAPSETDFSALADVEFTDTNEPEPEPAPAPVVEKGAAEPAPTVVAPPTAAVPPVQQQVVTQPSTLPPSEPAAAPVAQPPAAPQVQPAAAPAAAPAPVPAAPTEAELKAARSSLVDQISANYKLSEDDKAALLVDPDKVLPKIAGNLFVDVLEAVSRVVLGQVPQHIQQHMSRQNEALEARKAFFKEFPALDKPEYIPVLQQVTATYQQLNPKVPIAEARTAVGKLASAMLGLPAEGTSPAPTPTPVAPVRPATPLQPGATAVRPTQTAASNIFDELARWEPVDE